MSAAKPINDRTFGFGLRAMKKFPELIPLVTAIGFACGMCATYIGYALYQKPDVIVNKSKEHPPWERVDPEEKQKLLTFRSAYNKIPELEQLRREIGSYKN